jgi:hypothetical protein
VVLRGYSKDKDRVKADMLMSKAAQCSAVQCRVAPSTMSGLLGTPFSSRNSFQLSPLIVFGRPPAGTKASNGGGGGGGGRGRGGEAKGRTMTGRRKRIGMANGLSLPHFIFSHESNQHCRQCALR